MSTREALRFAVAVVLGAGATQALADVRSDYEAVFGREDRSVAATSTTLDDAVFAGKLLEAAKSLRDSPKLQVFVWERAYELGLKHRTGHAKALEAIELLQKTFPDLADKQAEWQAKGLAALETRFRHSRGVDRTATGQALLEALLDLAEAEAAEGGLKESLTLLRRAYPIMKYIKSPLAKESLAAQKHIVALLAARTRAEALIKTLTKRLATNPNDTRARQELIRLYVVEMGDVPAAARLLKLDLDETLRTCLPLAAKKMGETSTADCLTLGGWYKRLAGKASAAARPRILALAKIHYERFLALHGKEDAVAMSVRLPLKEVAGALDATGVVPCGIPKAHRQAMLATKRLNALAHWQADGAKWGQVRGQIVGEGDGALRFLHKLPGSGVLEFSLHVMKGMRPRIYFRGFYLGNEGFDKLFGFHGHASNRSGSYYPYDETSVMRIQLIMDGAQLELRINDKPLAKARRVPVEYETFRISCGDAWSKGTTKYWGFKFTPLPDKGSHRSTD